jgi:hypothetical protein
VAAAGARGLVGVFVAAAGAKGLVGVFVAAAAVAMAATRRDLALGFEMG